MISSNGRSTVTPVRMEPVAVQVRRLISDNKRYCKKQNKKSERETVEGERKKEKRETSTRQDSTVSAVELLFFRRIEILQNYTRKGKMPDFPCAIVIPHPPTFPNLISIG